jgi:hypothetical protein
MSISRKAYKHKLPGLFDVESPADVRALERHYGRDPEEQKMRQEIQERVERIYAQEKLATTFSIQALFQVQECTLCHTKQTVFRGLYKVKRSGERMAEQVNLTDENLALIERSATEHVGITICQSCVDDCILTNSRNLMR